MKPQLAEEDRLSSTAEPDAFKHLLRIVATLVVAASLLAGIAWLTSHFLFVNDASRLATVENLGANRAPSRPAGNN